MLWVSYVMSANTCMPAYSLWLACLCPATCSATRRLTHVVFLVAPYWLPEEEEEEEAAAAGRKMSYNGRVVSAAARGGEGGGGFIYNRLMISRRQFYETV